MDDDFNATQNNNGEKAIALYMKEHGTFSIDPKKIINKTIQAGYNNTIHESNATCVSESNTATGLYYYKINIYVIFSLIKLRFIMIRIM